MTPIGVEYFFVFKLKCGFKFIVCKIYFGQNPTWHKVPSKYFFIFTHSYDSEYKKIYETKINMSIEKMKLVYIYLYFL